MHTQMHTHIYAYMNTTYKERYVVEPTTEKAHLIAIVIYVERHV